MLFYPILSYPILSYTVLSYPTLLIRSYPILSHPILSHPIPPFLVVCHTDYRRFPPLFKASFANSKSRRGSAYFLYFLPQKRHSTHEAVLFDHYPACAEDWVMTPEPRMSCSSYPLLVWLFGESGPFSTWDCHNSKR